MRDYDATVKALRMLSNSLGTLRVLSKEIFSILVRRTLNVKEVTPDELPYRVDEKRFRRFSSRHTIFSRTMWDPKIMKIRERFSRRRKENLAKNIPGYSFVDYSFEKVSHMFSNIHRRILHELSKLDFNKEGKICRELLAPILTKLIKRASLFFGADLVGIANVDRKWLYAEASLPEEYRYVIVLAFEMDPYAIVTANEGAYPGEVGLGYSRMSIVSTYVSAFLRCLRFKAKPQGNEGSLSIPLAVLAGLGEVGRSGLLITPEYGPRVRLAKVFTNAPLIPDKPVRFGVWEFCRECQICAEACPAGAIPYDGPSWDGPTISEEKGVYKWHVNHEKCYNYWANIGRGCGICIKVCPYSKALWHHHRIKALEIALANLEK